MDTLQRSVKKDKLSFIEESDLIPVDSTDHFVLSRKGINYYLIDLREADWGRLGKIIRECERVESACWTPQENFSDYLKKCELLSYAEKDGSIVGFTAVSMMFFRKTCLYSNDETMVLKEFRNMKIAMNLVLVPLEWAFVKTGRFGGSTYFVFTSISANPRVVNFYFKNSWTRVLFDCSFKPSLSLIAIKNEYCRTHGIELVHEDYPFCMKKLFPGSNKFQKDDPRFQFTDQVKANMPPEFDHMQRGDAFAFLLKLPMTAVGMVIRILMLRCFGTDYLAWRGLWPFTSSKRREPSMGSGKQEKAVFPVNIVSHPKSAFKEGTLHVSTPRNGGPVSREME